MLEEFNVQKCHRDNEKHTPSDHMDSTIIVGSDVVREDAAEDILVDKVDSNTLHSDALLVSTSESMNCKPKLTTRDNIVSNVHEKSNLSISELKQQTVQDKTCKSSIVRVANNPNLPSQLSTAAPAVPCSVSNLLSDILNMRSATVKSSGPFPSYNGSGASVDSNKIDSNAVDKNNADIILNAVLNQPWMQSHRMMFPNTLSSALNKISWRKGKWIDEEEIYTKKLIEAFNNGYLKIPTGTTLRSFLSEKLSCDPMRITKKFAGSSAIGKQVFTPCDPNVDPTIIERVHVELKDLGDKFNLKIDISQSNSMSNQAIAIAAALRADHSNIKQSSHFESYDSQEFGNGGMNIYAKNKSLGLDSMSNMNYGASSREVSSPRYYPESSLSSLYFGGDVKSNIESYSYPEQIRMKKSFSSTNLNDKQIKKDNKSQKLQDRNSDGEKNNSTTSKMNTTSESSSSNGNYSSENSDENLHKQAHKNNPPKPNISVSTNNFPQYPIINNSNGKALIFPHSHPKKKISAAASLAAAVASSCSSSKFDRETSADDSIYAIRHSKEIDMNNGNKTKFYQTNDNNENTKKIKRTNSSTNINNNNSNNNINHKSNPYNVIFTGFMQKNNGKEMETGNSIASFCNAAAHAYSNNNDQSTSRASGRFPMATNVEQVDLDASDLLLNFFNSSNYPKAETVKTNSLTASDSDLNEPSGRSSSSSSDRGTSAALSDVESTSSRNGEGNSHTDNKHHKNTVDNKKLNNNNNDITNIGHNNYYTLETLQQNGESIASNAHNASNSRKRFSYQMRDVNNINEINNSKKIKFEENVISRDNNNT